MKASYILFSFLSFIDVNDDDDDDVFDDDGADADDVDGVFVNFKIYYFIINLLSMQMFFCEQPKCN